MPLIKRRITVPAGQTNAVVLTGTPYEYVDPGTNLVIAAQDSSAQYSAACGLNLKINNTEYAENAIISERVTGEPFGWRGNYVMNDILIANNPGRYRPIIEFRNQSQADGIIDFAIFISEQEG